jgi:hypothetical protein
MARITIDDLTCSAVLDRRAMMAIAGGARDGMRRGATTVGPGGTQRHAIAASAISGRRIVAYPPGFARDHAWPDEGRSGRSVS